MHAIRGGKSRGKYGTVGLAGLVACALLVAGTTGAVHNATVFELDGNATAGSGTDWASYFPTDDSPILFSKLFTADGPDVDSTYAVGGQTKDLNDVPQWRWNESADYPPKNEITNSYAIGLESGDSRIVYFGADRLQGGQSSLGFWFFKQKITLNEDGTFNGRHEIGDLFVVGDFTNGGRVSSVLVYQWVGGTNPLQLLLSGVDCQDASATDAVCGRVNAEATTAPWPYPGQEDLNGMFPTTAFFEAGINLGALGGGSFPCFFTLLTETRSSPELTATLRDFTLGSFATCFPNLHVTLTGNATTVEKGSSVTWNATVTNNGDAATENGAVTATAPAGLPVTSAHVGDVACQVVAQTITCPITLAPGASATITIVTGTSECGESSLTATATASNEPRSKLGDNSATAGVTVTCTQPPAEPVCPNSQGYWKNHASAWPLQSLTLGNRVYTKAQALSILNTAPQGDATYTLAHQLIAAKLNVANGADGSPVATTIQDADALLTSHPIGSKVKASSIPGAQMTTNAKKLDDYNNDRLTPECL
jgi:hypothetical protein